MSRPENITNEDIIRWEEIMKDDPLLKSLPSGLAESPILKEVCYAGLWLSERLMDLSCPLHLSLRVQFHAGKLSFGRDAWEVHQQILQDYIDNKLMFETDPDELLN